MLLATELQCLKMKKFTFFLLLSLLFSGNKSFSQLKINEIMASNDNVHQDEDGAFQDWIEIYNTTESQLDITGFGLSDDT